MSDEKNQPLHESVASRVNSLCQDADQHITRYAFHVALQSHPEDILVLTATFHRDSRRLHPVKPICVFRCPLAQIDLKTPLDSVAARVSYKIVKGDSSLICVAYNSNLFPDGVHLYKSSSTGAICIRSKIECTVMRQGLVGPSLLRLNYFIITLGQELRLTAVLSRKDKQFRSDVPLAPTTQALYMALPNYIESLFLRNLHN